jgi:hypothetical protein
VTLTTGRIVYQRRRALLGLIPLSMDTDTYPLANISAVKTKNEISILKLLVGAVLVAAGVALSVYAGGASTDSLGIVS